MKTCRKNWLFQFPKRFIRHHCQDTTAFFVASTISTFYTMECRVGSCTSEWQVLFKGNFRKNLYCLVEPTQILVCISISIPVVIYLYMIWAILCNKSWNENNTNLNERNVLDVYISLQVVYMSPVYFEHLKFYFSNANFSIAW